MNQRKHSDDRGVNLSYIITPFLDMSFQLLAFFIMTYHPSALEGHVDGRLVPPAALHGPAVKDPNELPGGEIEPDLGETVFVKVTAKRRDDERLRDGVPDTIFTKQPHDAVWTIVANADGNLENSLKKLEIELQRMVTKAGVIKLSLKIEADGNLRYADVMCVYDVGRQAGFQSISFVGPTTKK